MSLAIVEALQLFHQRVVRIHGSKAQPGAFIRIHRYEWIETIELTQHSANECSVVSENSSANDTTDDGVECLPEDVPERSECRLKGEILLA